MDGQTFVFDSHADFVAAAEQLADDMVAFNLRTNPEFTITVLGEISESLKCWFAKSADINSTCMGDEELKYQTEIHGDECPNCSVANDVDYQCNLGPHCDIC